MMQLHLLIFPSSRFTVKFMVLETIANNYLWFLVAILALNLSQRRYAPRSTKKRMATLIIACFAMLFQIFIVIILSRGWPQWLAFCALAVTLAAMIPLRKRIFLFKRRCVVCDAKLSATAIINYDDNTCDFCWEKEHPLQKDEESDQTADPSQDPSVASIDWDVWEPTETAVLCYLFDNDSVLLIDKKTGLGKGLVNAPGGHIEAEETAAEAAIRETFEETGITIPWVEYKGVLEFQFTDGLALRGHIFFAYEYEGKPIETDEARPFWCPVSEIPYNRMWEDDRLWLPLVLNGEQVRGRFVFDGETMLDSNIVVEASQTA